MLRPQIKITAADRKFAFVHGLEYKTSLETFTDSGFITIPSKVKRDGETITVGDNNVFKRGDPIKISLGYYLKITIFSKALFLP